jgi:hypothetical protein
MRAAALALLCLPSTGCERELSLGRLLQADGAASDAGMSTFSCAQHGPLLDLTDAVSGACGEASRGAHFALCSCSELITAGGARVDGFDSQRAPYAAGQASGALGANGPLYTNGDLQTGGSVIVAGSEGIPLTGDLTISGNLLDQGQLQGSHSVRVAGRARVAGDLRVSALQVTEGCTLSTGSALEVSAGVPAVTREPVTVAPPCRCDAGSELATLMSRAQLDNDNAALGLNADSALKVLDAPRELSLPCGRYYVGDINAQRSLTLHIVGRVALFVRDSIVTDSASTLTIDLADGAELDLFVGNGISASGPVSIGASSAPTRTRLYLGGPDTVFFGNTTTLAASLHAPRSELVSAGALTLFGAALVGRLSAGTPLLLHYDRALARDVCSAAACSRDADCSPLLRCDDGRCLP